jgi:hypothetical protein
MKATTVVLLALFCIATLGCAAAREEQRVAATAPTANVAGRWSGTVVSDGNVSLPVLLLLDQNGSNVTGNVTVAAHPELSGPVNGSMQGERLKLSLATETFSDLRVSQDKMTGVTWAGPVNLWRSK